jgi:hypothetical protein
MDMLATALRSADLFEGERLIRSFGANALLPLHPRKGDAPDDKPYVLGASAPRTVLGVVHLTNYRLVFRALDPASGAFSIFLPAIAQGLNISFLLVRKFRIVMSDGTHIDFVRWRVAPVLEALRAARRRAQDLDWTAIGQDIRREAHKIGDWSAGDYPVASTASVAKPRPTDAEI